MAGGSRHHLPGMDSPVDWAGRLTRDGSNGGAHRTFPVPGVPAAPSRSSHQMPGRWRNQVGGEAKECASDDVLVESIVLAYIVAEHPEGVTIPMLALHFDAELGQVLTGSAVERAVRELVCEGRLEIQGGKVVPTAEPASRRTTMNG
jgi:hypothetical protein